MTTVTLEALRDSGRLAPIDVELALRLTALVDEPSPLVALAVAIVSRKLDHGHVCLDLSSLAQVPPFEALEVVTASSITQPSANESTDNGDALSAEAGGQGEEPRDDQTASEQRDWPAIKEWLAAIRKSPLCGAPADVTPLVIDAADRLYLRRYWDHQERLAAAIRDRATETVGDLDGATLKKGLDRLFPRDGLASGERDLQRLAALTALQRRVSVISGGPGTGKTYTVVKILGLVIEQALAQARPLPRMTLVAPTGKAAARLSESIKSGRDTLPFSDEVRAAIPAEASTIHRALGVQRGRTNRFYRDARNPLLTDLLLVDEASMVDIALMARLLQALPDRARLIFLGDKDQLASVEAGAVLGDICDVGLGRGFSQSFAKECEQLVGEQPPLQKDAPASAGIGDCIVALQKSYRYAPGSGIDALAKAINAGQGELACSILESSDFGDVTIVPLGKKGALPEHLASVAVDGYGPYLEETEPGKMLARLSELRVLCAHRRGAQGVERVNQLVEQALARAKLVDPRGASYRGRPIIVTKNDYNVRLFNGDVGLIVEHEDEDGALRAYFVAADGTERYLAYSRIPAPESVYATTVHKSQGSEFRHVCVVLPEKLSAVVTRELLYTAVTRATERVTVYGDPKVLVEGIAVRTKRGSGLRELLDV